MPAGSNSIGLTDQNGATIQVAISGNNIKEINLLCKEAENVQFFIVNEPTLVKFKVEGNAVSTSKEQVIAEVEPDDIFLLTTTSWESGIGSILDTEITTSRGGEAYLQFMVNGINVGKIKLTTRIQDDAEIFTQKDIEKIKVFLTGNAESKNRKDCITTVNCALKLLYNNEKLQVGSQMSGKDSSGKPGTMPIMEGLGKVKDTFRIEYQNEKGQTAARGTRYKAESMKDNLAMKIDELIGKKIGYHIFGIALLDGYHCMMLTVDNRFPCNKIYILSDQIGTITAGWKEFNNGNDLNVFLSRLTKNWHSDRDIYSGTTIWKLQR